MEKIEKFLAGIWLAAMAGAGVTSGYIINHISANSELHLEIQQNNKAIKPKSSPNTAFQEFEPK